MADRNRYGLSRDIPEKVKREVRQRDGFGCVVCGKAIIEYEHFDPEFKDARSHSAAGIILLCKDHHGEKTLGFLSRKTIERHAASPRARQKGFSFGAFDIGDEFPELVIGNVVFKNVQTAIQIFDDQVFSVSPPEEHGGPFRLSASIRDLDGNVIFKIVDNEWRVGTQNWDARTRKNRILIGSHRSRDEFILRSDPPGKLIVERISMRHRELTLVAKEGQPTVVGMPDGREIETQGIECDGFAIGIHVSQQGLIVGDRGGPCSLLEIKTLSAKAPHNSRVPPERNSPCYCGSGKRYKHCHERFE